MTGPLDIERHDALLNYLHETGCVGQKEVPEFTTLSGGVSNRTVLVERPSGQAWVLKQALPKLRVKEDWFSNPARSHREALGLTWLGRLAPPGAITSLVFEDADRNLFAMQAVAHPHENWKKRLLAGRIERDHVRQFGELLGVVHHRAREFRRELASLFDDRSFFESLRLEPYYRFTALQQPAAAEFLRQLIADTLAARLTLVHGDYSPKNILVHRDRLVLLDHEVVHWGDPAFDLGFALTHLLSKGHHLPTHRAAFLEAAQLFWTSYQRAGGGSPAESVQPSRHELHAADLEERAIRHTLGCLLARVDGRSPLEYLSERDRNRQRVIVLDLMRKPPVTMPELFQAFGAGLKK
jgi:aminoglycoside phosphotransferase (APT) family kinase protein